MQLLATMVLVPSLPPVEAVGVTFPVDGVLTVTGPHGFATTPAFLDVVTRDHLEVAQVALRGTAFGVDLVHVVRAPGQAIVLGLAQAFSELLVRTRLREVGMDGRGFVLLLIHQGADHGHAVDGVVFNDAVNTAH